MRPTILLSLACCLALIVACGRPRQLVPREFATVAHMVEDLTHGLDRRVNALIADGASDGQLAVAGWLRARLDNDRVTGYPIQIERRRQRWPLLRGGLTQGLIEALPNGHLRLAAQASNEDRRIFEQPLREEQRDRDQCDGILISISQFDPFSPRANALLTTVREVRHRLDQELSDVRP